MIRIRMTCLFAIISVVMFSGCASICSKSDYPVRINSSPQGAQVKVVTSKGEIVHTGTTPTTISLNAHGGYFRSQKYTVTFEKPGFDTRTAPIRAGMDGWYWVNILWIELCPIGFLIVDPLTGSMWTLKDCNVVLTPSSSSSLGNPGSQVLII